MAQIEWLYTCKYSVACNGYNHGIMPYIIAIYHFTESEVLYMHKDGMENDNSKKKRRVTPNENPFQHKVDYKYDNPTLLAIAKRQQELGWSDYKCDKFIKVRLNLQNYLNLKSF